MGLRGISSYWLVLILGFAAPAAADPNLAPEPSFQPDRRVLEAISPANLCLTCIWSEALKTDRKIRADYPFLNLDGGAKIPVNQQPGLVAPEDASLPPKVREAAKSVFRVFSITDTQDLSFDDYEHNLKTYPFQYGQQRTIAEDLFRVCKERKTAKCPFPIGVSSATAFLAGDGAGKKLWTNGHVLRRAYQAIDPDFSKYDSLVAEGKLIAPFFIFNREGKLLKTPLDLTMKVARAPSGAEMKANNAAQDLVEIDLDRSIGTPLKIAAKPTAGQTIYRPGYPTCTGCDYTVDKGGSASRFPYTDSDGFRQFVSRGTSFPSTPANVATIIQAKDATDKKTLILSNNDSRQGFSGAPDLNENGEVVAVHFAFQPRRHPRDQRVQTTVSLSVRPPEWK